MSQPTQIPFIAAGASIPRRTLLRGAGAALSLPLLEAMTPAFARANPAAADATPPRRMMAVCNNLGFVPDLFYPTDGAEDSSYLAELAGLRNRVTVLDGVSHPGVTGSHATDICFLTAATGPSGGGFRNSVSLDQFIAARVGHETRFPSLTLGVNAQPGRRSLSWTESGVLIPCEDKASDVYRRLFLRGTDAEVREQLLALRMGRSIMDSVGEQSKRLRQKLGAGDRDRLDQFETAVRDVERRLTENEEWIGKPKPEAPIPQPSDPDDRTQFMEKARLMFEMAKLAFETDSTRAITLLLDTNFTPSVSDLEDRNVEITDGYHNLSHHGKNPKKLAQLEAIDRGHFRQLRHFLDGLQSVEEGDVDLLANTATVYGSNLGDANKHTTTNMPVLVAGGRFRHGGTLRFDREDNYPLPNLFVSVLQQMGFEEEQFASSTGTMRGLESAG